MEFDELSRSVIRRAIEASNVSFCNPCALRVLRGFKMKRQRVGKQS